MVRTQNAADAPAHLARNLVQALLRERVVPRFVDSYVVENSRQALQVHASLYRDLLTIEVLSLSETKPGRKARLLQILSTKIQAELFSNFCPKHRSTI